MQPQRWHEISDDPNAPEVRAHRCREIERARASTLVEDRLQYLSALAKGRSVLDIGVVNHRAQETERSTWLHGHLRGSARRCKGVDILEAEVRALRERGYDVVCADVTVEPLPEQFELIVCAEVIEHVGAPGALLNSCARMLAPGGRLIVTTPNPWYVNAVIKSVRASSTLVDSADHVAWYDASTLIEIGARCGLSLDRFAGVAVTNPRTLAARLAFGLQRILTTLGFSREIFAHSIIYEFVLSSGTAASLNTPGATLGVSRPSAIR